MHFGKFEGNKFIGSGTIEYQIYDYYIGQWENDSRHGKGILCYKNGRKYLGNWVNDIVVGKGKLIMNMVNIMKVDGKMVQGMEKVSSIMKMGRLNLKVTF